MTERKPHRVVARIDRWGSVALQIECPYTLADRQVRRCNLGTEPDRCDWTDWENGEHHWNCDARKDRNAPCSGGPTPKEDGAPACWESDPEECDGFEGEVGHLHPTEGCWAQELISEIGWDEAVHWKVAPQDVDLPIEVDVESDDEGIYLSLWTPGNEATDAEPQPESRVPDLMAALEESLRLARAERRKVKQEPIAQVRKPADSGDRSEEQS